MSNHLRLPVLALVLFSTFEAFAGTHRCWVRFTDRQGAEPGKVSEETRAARQRQGIAVVQASDAFPAAAYKEAVEALAGHKARTQSRWLNAVSIEADPEALARIATLPFVTEVRPVQTFITARAQGEPLDTVTRLGRAFRGVGGGWLVEQNLTAKGVKVGLIDAGFGDADRTDDLKHLFANNQITAYRDFEMPSHTDFFRKSSSAIDNHGTDVLGYIAGQEGTARYGGAVNATFCLARTDNVEKEYRHEEDLWLNALEWMDSLGVRIINTSLGYGLGFDDKAQNHKLSDVDGKTSVATRAVNTAVEEKGIVVVVSAGNDGGKAEWRIITVPADAPGAIAVAANFEDVWEKVGYSSIGPDSLPYVKPDVSAYSLMGTSFSAPVITGVMACLMERHPGLKPAQYAAAIRQSGHLQGAPNNYLGYGVANARRASSVLDGKPELASVKHVQASGGTYTVSGLPGNPATAVVFHKKDKRQVVKQGRIKLADGKAVLRQEENAAFTTVATPEGVVEIEWGKGK